jgi:hypothetical protein
MHKLAQSASILKRHNPGYFGKQSIVAPDSNIQSRFDLGSPLSDYDGSTADKLSGKTLHSKSLGLTISSVPGASDSLFMCHTNPS